MALPSRSVAPTPWGALFFALLGLAWCGYVAFPTSTPAPCLTSGCSLFKDIRFAGISLWWVGGAYFFTLAILCLRGKRRIAFYLARAALFIDSILLLIMYFTAPCFDCLVVALFMPLCFFFLRPTQEGWFGETPGPSVLLPLWIGLFLGNAAMAGNESLPQWAISNASNQRVRLYFSPSCPACRDALLAFGGSAALYPVAENDEDTSAILRLEAFLAAKVPMAEAIERCRNPQEPVPALSPLHRALVSMRLLRNKAAVFKQGFTSLPLLQVNGMPALPGRKNAQPPAAQAVPGAEARENIPAERRETPSFIAPPNMSPRQPGASSAGQGHEGSEPWNMNDLGQCRQDSPGPCADPRARP